MILSDVLMFLTKILIILIFIRLCYELLPGWLLVLIIFLLVFYSGILDPALVQGAVGASSGLVDALLPFVVLLFAFWIIAAGLFGRRRR